MTDPSIIFVDDEEHIRNAVTQTFKLADLKALVTADPVEAVAAVSMEHPGVLVTDIRMPAMGGIDVLQKALARDPEYPVIMITGHGDVDLAVRCMRDGAYDFIEKPFAPDLLVATIRRALDKRQLTLENRTLRTALDNRRTLPGELRGHSSAIAHIRQEIAQLADTDIDLLITGEVGTGKESVARAIHEMGPRASHPFVVVDCAVLPDDLVEIELFGHEAGAFPSAIRQRFGRFETARGGTVFLDNIESLSPKVRTKLVRAIETRRITRLGSNDEIDLDVRFIGCTGPDPSDAEDTLSLLLSVAKIEMPSLDQRRDDIGLLFLDAVSHSAVRTGKPTPNVPHAVLSSMSTRQWPGNLRELRVAAQRFVLGLDKPEQDNDGPASLATMLEDTERALIAASLATNMGNLKATYEALGVSRKALYDKMQRHGLKREDFLPSDDNGADVTSG